MKFYRPIIVLLFTLALAGCGVDKFLIERAVNNINVDVMEKLEEFATLSKEQEQDARVISDRAELWVKQTTLPQVATLIDRAALDIESNGLLAQQTYDDIVAFFYRPLPLSDNTELFNDVARFFYQMSEAQDAQVREQLLDDFAERQEKRDERDLSKQKDGIIKSLKTAFRGMGVARTRAQLAQARDILDARIDLGQQTNDYYFRVNQQFIDLTQNKGDSLADFTARYKSAWQALEAGPHSEHPVEFKQNADNGLAAINYLFSTLDATEQATAATVMHDYTRFFLDLLQNESP